MARRSAPAQYTPRVLPAQEVSRAAGVAYDTLHRECHGEAPAPSSEAVNLARWVQCLIATLKSKRDKLASPPEGEFGLLHQFDAIEVHPLVYCYDYVPSTGVPELVQDDEWREDAPRWGVFGHLPGAGLDDICDCRTKEMAELVAAVLRQTVEVAQALEGNR